MLRAYTFYLLPQFFCLMCFDSVIHTAQARIGCSSHAVIRPRTRRSRRFHLKKSTPATMFGWSTLTTCVAKPLCLSFFDPLLLLFSFLVSGASIFRASSRLFNCSSKTAVFFYFFVTSFRQLVSSSSSSLCAHTRLFNRAENEWHHCL